MLWTILVSGVRGWEEGLRVHASLSRSEPPDTCWSLPVLAMQLS